MGNQGWFEYGGRLGFRVQKGWVVDLFANGTLGPQPVGNTIHGGVGLSDELPLAAFYQHVRSYRISGGASDITVAARQVADRPPGQP